MKDVNGKPLAVGDLVQLVVTPLDPRCEVPPLGTVFAVAKIEPHPLGGKCPRCGISHDECAIFEGPRPRIGVSPCIIMKISPDPDQFANEEEREAVT